MFQTYAFQSYAFQTSGTGQVDNGWLGGPKDKYTYAHPYVQFQNEEAQREKIRKEKTELQKLESVLQEAERKRKLAAENQLLASKKRARELAQLELEYLAEINRLLAVRAELIQRIRQEEEVLIIILMMRRRRLCVA